MLSYSIQSKCRPFFPVFHSWPHLCDYSCEMSTALLLAQAQYQEPFPFLGEFIKRISIWLLQLTISLYPSSAHLFSISVCPLMCPPSLKDLSPHHFVIYHPHSNCAHSVNSTFVTARYYFRTSCIWSHYTLANGLFCSVLACRWFIFYGAMLFVVGSSL